MDFSNVALPKEKALEIRGKVKLWTGIPISIGVAPTKALAKVANHYAKKFTVDGVLVLEKASFNLLRIIMIKQFLYQYIIL